MLAAELQQVSENQLKGLRMQQDDGNKYLSQLTKIISDSTKLPVKGVSEPAPFRAMPMKASASG